jgi:putative flippase GtrA
MKKFLISFVNKHKLFYEIIKFLIVGTITTMIDFFVMSLVIYIFDAGMFDYNLVLVFLQGKNATTVAVVTGTAIGFVCGTLFSFWASNYVVFENNKFSTSDKGFVLFVSLALAGLLIHTLGMWLGYQVLNINEWIVKVVLTGVVMVFNYLTRKFIIFSKNRSDYGK